MAFTDEQERALKSIEEHRMTVVRAGPGSGKTRVFVEAFRRLHESWSEPRRGIAALSFTNVAHEVVSERLGGTPAPPHLVTTLDAFFLRFVLRPFGHLVGLAPAGLKVIAPPFSQLISEPRYRPAGSFRSYGIFAYDFTFSAETGIRFRMPDAASNTPPTSKMDSESILTQKRRVWAMSGRISLSDAQYLACELLRGKYAQKLVELLAIRFPVLLVDEFQDTNYFLAGALGPLIKCDRIKVVLVGDPDQAIFQFGGAVPGLFPRAEKLATATVELVHSHRCPPAIATAASLVARSGKVVRPVKTDAGLAVLLVHKQGTIDAGQVVEAVRKRIGADAELALLARHRSTVAGLRRCAETPCPWKSGLQLQLARAAQSFSESKPRQAATIVRRLVKECITGAETKEVDVEVPEGIERSAWNEACRQVLWNLAEMPPNETWNEWVVRQKAVLVQTVADLVPEHTCWFTRGLKRFPTATLKKGGDPSAPRKNRGDVPRMRPDQLMRENETVLTVHAAKGREFPHVLFYSPKPSGRIRCPSTAWWENDTSSEEQEVAFVALSRASESLFVAMYDSSYKRLKKERRAFVDLFEIEELAAPLAHDHEEDDDEE